MSKPNSSSSELAKRIVEVKIIDADSSELFFAIYAVLRTINYVPLPPSSAEIWGDIYCFWDRARWGWRRQNFLSAL